MHRVKEERDTRVEKEKSVDRGGKRKRKRKEQQQFLYTESGPVFLPTAAQFSSCSESL